MTLVCPSCRASNPDGMQFCETCGAALPPAPVVCPSCGTPNPPGDRFCSRCGADLYASRRPTQPGPVGAAGDGGRGRSLTGVVVVALLVGVVGIAAAFYYFSGDDDTTKPAANSTSTPADQTATAAPSTRTVSATATPARAATATPTLSPTATPSPTPTPTATPPAGALGDALAAAARHYDALARPGPCNVDNPQGKSCIWVADGVPSTPDRGTAVFLLSSPTGGGAIAVYGRSLTTGWGPWFVTQNAFYQLLQLPGDMLVCADGQGANVRDVPLVTATSVRLLPDLSRVTVDLVVLLEEAVPNRAGEAWYRLTAPVAGWIRSDLLTDAALGNCTLRDQLHSSF